MLDHLGKKPRTVKGKIAFSDDNLEGTSQPHNNALVVTLRIGGFLVKRVIIDQGSNIEIMYPDLYKGLGLNTEDLRKYDTYLIGFDEKMVTPERQIRLPVVADGKEVLVFIVVNAFSTYTAILVWLWIHDMGAVPSTLHVKVKFSIEEGVVVMRGDQKTASQCLVATINHEIK